MSSKARIFILLAGGFLTGITLGVIVLVGEGLITPFAGVPGSRTGLKSAGPSIGKPAPDFTIKSIDGNNLNLADYYGKPVIVNFWATWCAPCRYEMPYFEKRYLELRDRLNVIAINSGESEQTVSDFIDELDLSFDVGIDVSGETQISYFAVGLPRTFFIDKDGIILAQHIGAMSEKQLDGYIKLLEIPDA